MPYNLFYYYSQMVLPLDSATQLSSLLTLPRVSLTLLYVENKNFYIFADLFILDLLRNYNSRKNSEKRCILTAVVIT